MKKKGFTLIELLAVIVILAIIALIATPIVLNMINSARKSAAKASALGFIEAVDNNNGFADIGTEGYIKISDGEIEVEDIDVKMKGKKPISGTVTITKGKISEASLCINEYTVTYDGKEAGINGKCDSRPRYKEELLNGADPVLKNELIPVIIENDGTVKYADTAKKWYKYSEKKWANAVVLFDGETANVGDVIPESKIKEYFVWIPRYKYKLFNAQGNSNTNKEKPIEIVFENKSTTPSISTTNGEYLTHPAFTNFETNGIWVGKYEVSYNDPSYLDNSKFIYGGTNSTITTVATNVTIKPNTRIMTNKSVSQFETMIMASNTSLNSHVITNMEWGATAYLTYSIYGRCDSTSCTALSANNARTNGGIISGCYGTGVSTEQGTGKVTCNDPYNSSNGYLTSTTGNINGIYDMSGGYWEYVMGVLKYSDGIIYSGRTASANSGYNGKLADVTDLKTDGLNLPDSKYYNLYTNNISLGDATKEVSGGGMWFNDIVDLPTPVYPWIIRGAGGTVFRLSCDYGKSSGDYTTRMTLAF